MPSISIYRPPAARRHEPTANCVASPEKESSENFVEKNECKLELEEGRRRDARGISVFKNAITSIKAQTQPPKCKVGVRVAAKNGKGEEVPKPRQRRPDMKVYVPKARRVSEELSKAPARAPEAQELPIEEENGAKDSGYFGIDEVKKIDDVAKSNSPEVIRGEDSGSDVEFVREEPCHKKNEFVDCDRTNFERNHAGEEEAKPKQTVSPTSLWIEAQNEIQPEVNRKSIVSSQKSDSSGSDSSPKGSLEKICDVKPEEQQPGSRSNPAARLNPEECDWETMYDDSGECLDPSLLDQLSSAVGAVTIEKPKSNYDTFKTKTLDMVSNEFPHVIEIYNFPPEFELQDLMMAFSQFKNAGFEIKWVDNTHALGIFSNSQIVSEVLAFRHSFVKTRSLKDGTMLSKAKARRLADQLLPYKPRPDTCPALARRLVTGALGVRLPTSREEREAERKILLQAREKKKLEAKQREEAWEGTFH